MKTTNYETNPIWWNNLIANDKRQTNGRAAARPYQRNGKGAPDRATPEADKRGGYKE